MNRLTLEDGCAKLNYEDISVKQNFVVLKFGLEAQNPQAKKALKPGAYTLNPKP